MVACAMRDTGQTQKIRLAELLGALCHGWRIWELYRTLPLKDLGCSSNAARVCQLYLTDDLTFKHDLTRVDATLAA